METEPPAPSDSTPPESPPVNGSEEPVEAVPTKETTPVWAQSNPAAPALKKGDPDWSRPETPSNGDSKPSRDWAATVPTSPGEEEAEPEEKASAPQAAVEPEPPAAVAESRPPEAAPEPEPPAAEVLATEPPAVAPLTDPPKAVASDATRSTWPPASAAPPAPPEETDIWPPEPPTERAMQAWPPPSELEEPATPAQAIPRWPDSFDATPATAPTAPTVTPPPKPAAPSAPPAEPATPATIQPTAAAVPPAPVPPSQPTPSTVPVTPAPSPDPAHPATPAQAAPPARPTWAPGPVVETSAPAGHTAVPQHMQVPNWAPHVPLASEPGTPTWFSPKENIPHATQQQMAQPAAPEPEPTPAAPVVGGQLPVAPVPAPQPAAAQAQPPNKPAWQVVEQPRKSGPHPPVQAGPTPEDRSYAEWFAWAKRGGAPASACHAAAQGAFKALSSGKDVNTAVQWATAAMSRPPEQVSYARQQYCAWFALANIDLNLDQHRAHLFAHGAIQALDAGQDSSAAHAAGLAAAGIR